MAKEKLNLGPSATYLNLDGSARVVTTFGVRFEADEPVDLIEELGASRGAAALAKLAGNPFFEVEGNTADHGDRVAAVRTEAGEKARAKPRKPAVSKAVKKQIAEENADKGVDASEDDDELTGTGNDAFADELQGEVPETVETPGTATLESAARPRLARRRAS